MQPTIDQLRYFVAVAESGSITQSAKQLFISQQALGKALDSLEKELSMTLFERSAKGTVLTPAGQQVRVVALQMLSDYDTGVNALSTIAHKSDYALRVCFENVALMKSFPYELLSTIGDIRIMTYVSSSATSYLNDLKREKCDIAVVSGRIDTADTTYIQLINRQVEVIMGIGHYLASEDAISYDELRYVPHVWITMPSLTADNYIKHCIDHGFYPNFVAEYPDVGLCLQAVSEGRGISVGSGVDRSYDDRIVRKPFASDPPMFEVGLLVNKGREQNLRVSSYINAAKVLMA